MVIQGDILEETAEILINCFGDVQESKTIKAMQIASTATVKLQAYQEKVVALRPGEILVQDYQNEEIELSLQYVIHFKVPSCQIASQICSNQNRDDTDLMQYYIGYKDCLQKANELGGKIVVIDDCCSKSPPIPRQYNAEILIKSVLHYIEENPQTTIQWMKIISFSKQNVKFIKYEMDKYMEEVKDEQFALRRREVFFSFINPSEMDKSFSNTERDNNKNDFSISNIKLNNNPDFEDQTIQKVKVEC